MSDIIILSDDEEPSPKKSKLENNESVVISDDEVTTNEEINENIPINNFVPHQSEPASLYNKFTNFLDICAESLRGSTFEDRLLIKFPKIKERYESCSPEHVDTTIFQNVLNENIALAKLSDSQAVVAFKNVYTHLSDISTQSNTQTPRNYKKIKLLTKTMNLLLKKINYLKECEVNFDEEENSTYMKLDRYTQRLDKVYKKYCKLLNINCYKGRLTYDKLNFISSNNKEINRAITKMYNNNKSFPTYYEVEKCIKKCVNKHNLRLSETEIRLESQCCFKKLGEMLKSRRQHELYDFHTDHITRDDPSTSSPELKSVLEKNKQFYDEKMSKIIEKYTKLQDNYVDIELSEDSDDSHYEDKSDNDNKDEDSNDKN